MRSSDDRRGHFMSSGRVLLIALSLGCAMSQRALAQPALPTKVTSDVDLTSAQRDALYASLAKEVAELERHHNIIKTAARLVSPTVVHIEAISHDSVSRPHTRRTIQEAGSGVIIELKGSYYVLTNRHVIKDAKLTDIAVKFSDGRVISPTKVWGDPDTDVAVLALSGTNFVPVRIGDSDKLDIGDMVLALGSPFGLSHSITYGIVSAKGRRDLELGDGGVRFQDFIQTDASINPGNSGGPLINLRGEVIGINTAIASDTGAFQGVGFSIPINMTMIVAKQLIEHGIVTRAYLGVRLDAKFSSIQAAEMGLPRLSGARLLRIEAGSPAEGANLQAGDVVLQFNGVRIENDTHLVNIVGLTPVNAEVPIVIYRNRQTINMKVRVGNAAAPAAVSSKN